METSQDLVAEAEAVKARFERDAYEIRSQGLDKDVEQARLAELFLETDQKLAGLKQAHGRLEAREQSAAQRKVYGAEDLLRPGTDAATHQVSYRDAQDRADRADGEQELSRLMERAIGSGDALLARACAARAVQLGMTDVVASYENENPGFVDAVREAKAQRQSMGLARAIWFGVKKPTEIAALSADDMRRQVASVEERLARVRGERRYRRTANFT